MRAAVVNTAGEPPVCAEFADPVARPGQEPLHLVGAGLHHVVRGLAAGRHYGSDHTFPLVPGVDAVARTGDGRLVYTGFARAPWGTMAERMVTPFELELPAGADPLEVAAGMNPGLSGWMVLSARRKEVGRLGTVLVLGATGASGTLAVRAAQALGAERVVAAGRDPESLERLRGLGAVPVSLGHDEPGAVAHALAAAVDDAPPALVLDFVWGPVAEAAFAALGRGGPAADGPEIAYVQIGSLAGSEAALPAALLRSRRIRITGSGIGAFSRAELLAEAPAVLAAFADGTLQMPYTAYPLSRVGDAWAHRGSARAVVVPD
ncbi:zinc-binding alcohol dehydrogenase family protein [Promicromonospora thailandica]|uniref:NADPH:quinone reductase n=1 Tax=Promicromonospora thailandica TaxID=765201 RepID=A0A9X2G242_9MICO|nr:zinc-binding alcohol dehydrogenase family protein [Promicromonospora thailandica]MCP2265657.1 NADPH:quinone reductase [Promicromonospora thailandica]BFF21663.1 zinc-binding alcohol dehydrogenase family protein [Promicromonospora thailandica]